MGFGELSEMLNAISVPGLGAIGPETALFGLSVLFFGFSTGLCALAVRAASGARNAQDDTAQMLRTVQDYAIEVRDLASSTERASLAVTGEAAAAPESLKERLGSVRVGSRHDAGEAEIAMTPDDQVASDEVAPDDGAQKGLGDETRDAAIDSSADATTPGNTETDNEANARLADATIAASEPRSLLASMLRRR